MKHWSVIMDSFNNDGGVNYFLDSMAKERAQKGIEVNVVNKRLGEQKSPDIEPPEPVEPTIPKNALPENSMGNAAELSKDSGAATDALGAAGAAASASPWIAGASLALSVIQRKQDAIAQAKANTFNSHQQAMSNAVNWYQNMKVI